jgi:hypothetical protein
MAARHAQPGLLKLGDELGAGEDPQVAALHLVVLIRQRPAHPLRQPGGYGDRRDAARPQHPRDLRHRPPVGRHVLQDLGRNHLIESIITKRKIRSVAPNRTRGSAWSGFPFLVHRAQHCAHAGQLATIEVGRHNAGTTAIRLKGVPAGAATQVEQSLARGDLKLTEVDCQHAGSG